jgi:hypothetical protein
MTEPEDGINQRQCFSRYYRSIIIIIKVKGKAIPVTGREGP